MNKFVTCYTIRFAFKLKQKENNIFINKRRVLKIITNDVDEAINFGKKECETHYVLNKNEILIYEGCAILKKETIISLI